MQQLHRRSGKQMGSDAQRCKLASSVGVFEGGRSGGRRDRGRDGTTVATPGVLAGVGDEE